MFENSYIQTWRWVWFQELNHPGERFLFSGFKFGPDLDWSEVTHVVVADGGAGVRCELLKTFYQHLSIILFKLLDSFTKKHNINRFYFEESRIKRWLVKIETKSSFSPLRWCLNTFLMKSSLIMSSRNLADMLLLLLLLLLLLIFCFLNHNLIWGFCFSQW